MGNCITCFVTGRTPMSVLDSHTGVGTYLRTYVLRRAKPTDSYNFRADSRDGREVRSTCESTDERIRR